jgi:hypothetical protein
MQSRGPSSSVGVILALIGVYLAFVVWMYVNEPVILAVFSAALVLIWLREAAPRFLRKLVPVRLPTRREQS